MSNLVKWDPLSELSALQKQFFGDDFWTNMRANVPTTDVYTKDNTLFVEAHLPNFDEKNVDISVDDGALIISASKHERDEDKGKQYVVRESASSFYRRVQLPERADIDKISADLDDGVLKVSVPLAALPEPKKVKIEAKSKK